MMERLGKLLAGRAGYTGDGTTNPDMDRRVEAVVSRVDGLEERANALDVHTGKLENRVTDLEQNQERSDDRG